MRNQITLVIIFMIVLSCNTSVQNQETKQTKIPIEGTWKLITGTLVEKGDTVVTDYTK